MSRIDVTPINGSNMAPGTADGRPAIDTGVYVNASRIWKARLIYKNKLFDLGR